jgi:hypothetical protein
VNNQVITDFQKITDELIAILNLLSNIELNKVPFPGSWTAGQVGDHLIKSYGVWDIFNGHTADPGREYDQNCKLLTDLFLNFEIIFTVEPDEFNYPSDDFINKVTLLKELKLVTNDIIEFSNTKNLYKVCLDREFPTFGYLTRYEWLHFFNVHTQRHIYQLNNIVNNLKEKL